MVFDLSNYKNPEKIWNFTGIILLPGSFSGRISSPKPQRGPLYKQNSVSILKVQKEKVNNYESII